MGVKGDFAKLRRISRGLRDAFGASSLRGLNRNLAEETVELVRGGFDKQRDPYGKPWAPLKYRDGRILQDTGQLRHFKPVRVTEQGFIVGSGAEYGPYHQRGTRVIPARKMVPDKALPPKWAKALSATARKYLKAKLEALK